MVRKKISVSTHLPVGIKYVDDNLRRYLCTSLKPIGKNTCFRELVNYSVAHRCDLEVTHKAMEKYHGDVIHCYDNEEMVIHALRRLQRKHAFPRDVLVYLFQVYLAMATPLGWDEERLGEVSLTPCRCFRELLTGGGGVRGPGFIVTSLMANRSIIFPSNSSRLQQDSFRSIDPLKANNTVALGGVTEIELVLRAGERDSFAIGLFPLDRYLQLSPRSGIDQFIREVTECGLLYVSARDRSNARWIGGEGNPTFCRKRCRGVDLNEILLIRIDARPCMRKLAIASRGSERFSPREELLGHSFCPFAESVPLVPVVMIRTSFEFEMRLISYKYLPNG
jgi:hypothetical protein